MRLLITGGSGFIGSALVRTAVASGMDVINVDKMTYAATEGSTASVAHSPLYAIETVDIVDTGAIATIVGRFQPDAIVHLAAESHVDRSIEDPLAFARTNVVGTFSVLSAATHYFESLAEKRQKSFRFVHISTDEVFGSLGSDGVFDLDSSYDPRSPYSATKAGADHGVRSWGHTYGLPVIISNCSNNYGPFQFPEKLIPMMTIRAMERKPLPVFGTGQNVRDWLHVSDHTAALLSILSDGTPGSTYLIGGDAERSNIEVVNAICDVLDELTPMGIGQSHRDLIAYVEDRPGHDFRYAIDASETKRSLTWAPSIEFEVGLRSTIEWYIDNEEWWRPLVTAEGATRRAGTIDRQRGGA